MNKKFEITFLEEAFEFLKKLDKKHAEKVLYNIRKSRISMILNYLKNSVTKFGSLELYIKVFNTECWLFGIKRQPLKLWLSTHGFVKKQSKVPDNEIDKAINLRVKYFNEKQA